MARRARIPAGSALVLLTSMLVGCGGTPTPTATAGDPCQPQPQYGPAVLPDRPTEVPFDLGTEVHSVVEAGDAVVVVPYPTDRVIAYDARTLERRWEYRSEREHFGLRGSPELNPTVATDAPLRVAGDVVLVGERDGDRGYLVAIDVADGAPRWTVTETAEGMGLLYADACRVVLAVALSLVPEDPSACCYPAELRGYDRATGTELWRTEFPIPIDRDLPGVTEGWAYVHAEDSLTRVNMADGATQSVALPAPDCRLSVLPGGRARCGDEVFAIDWAAGTASAQPATDQDAVPAAVIQDVHIFADDYGSSVAAYREGTLLWRRTGDEVGAVLPPIVQRCGGLLLDVRYGAGLSMLDPETGHTRWTFDRDYVESSVFCDPATKTIFFVARTSTEGYAHAIDATTGEFRWTVPASVFQPGYGHGWLIVNDPESRLARAYKVR